MSTSVAKYLSFYTAALTAINVAAYIGFFVLTSLLSGRGGAEVAGTAVFFAIFSLFIVLPWAVLFAVIHSDVLRALDARAVTQPRTFLGYSLLTSALLGSLPFVVILRGAQDKGDASLWTPALAFLASNLATGYVFARFWSKQDAQERAGLCYDPRTGAVVGAALGWTAGYYGPFLYRAALGIPGGNLTGIAEFFTGVPMAVLGGAAGSAVAALGRRARMPRPNAHGTPMVALSALAILVAAFMVLRASPPPPPTARPLSQTVPGYKPVNADLARTRTPVSFRLVVPGQTKERKWTRSLYGWRERMSSGESRRFLLAGAADVEGQSGFLYQERNDRDLHVFLPERGSKRLRMRQWRSGQGEWKDLGEMKEIQWPGKTLPRARPGP